jgi:hypothetical protein
LALKVINADCGSARYFSFNGDCISLKSAEFMERIFDFVIEDKPLNEI